MSRARGFNLEEIYNKQSLTRLEASKFISQGDDRYVRSTLGDDPFFKRVLLQFGQDGIRQLIRTIQLRRIEKIDLKETLWVYVLEGTLAKKEGCLRKKDSIQLDNPQQSQIQPTKKSKGLALVFSKASYDHLRQRHEVRQLNKKVQIFNKLPLFSEVPHTQLKALCRIIPEQRFQKNNIVYHQNQLAQKLYIVKDGVFVMNRYCEARRKCKSVLLLDNCNIFGEQCLQESIRSQSGPRYLCEVSCKSNEGTLFVIDREILAKFPPNKDLTLSSHIYQMYAQRRKLAEGKQFEEGNNDLKELQGDRIKKYCERLHRFRKRNPSKYTQQDEDLHTDVEFFRQEEFASMKLKLKYQSILDKVRTMNTVTLKKVEINSKNQPKNFMKGLTKCDREKKLILKSLERRQQSRQTRTNSQRVIDVLKMQAVEDSHPRHKSQYLRVKPTVDFYNIKTCQSVAKNQLSRSLEPIKKIRTQSSVYNFVESNL